MSKPKSRPVFRFFRAARGGKPLARIAAAAVTTSVLLQVPSAEAAPLFYAGKAGDNPVVHSSHVILMKRDDGTVVTIMPDYQGNLTPFALITTVPKDVTEDRLVTLKREFVDRVDQISAPRFAEFWEMDPCDTGEVEQEWERNLQASDSGAFLGVMKTDPSKKVAKELLMDVEAQEKKGELELELLDSWAALTKWLDKRGMKAPEGAKVATMPYLEAGQKLLVAEVDPNRLELVGGDRAQLSPFQFWTEQSYESIPARLGLTSSSGKQELFVYVMEPEHRFETKNYPNKFAPTNLNVKFKVKERMGEFYAGLHDLFLDKNPGTFLTEFAWPTKGCGQPCATDALLPHELMSLGGAVFDRKLPEDVRNPEPEEPTEEEQAKFEASVEGKSPKEKKEAKEQWEEDRATIAARRAMLDRHQYVLTRLHYRYGKSDLPKDPKLGPASSQMKGGVALPEGKEGKASSDVEPAKQSEFQTRYNHLHPNKKVINCDAPKAYRWGKAPPTYRGLRKIWVAEDLTRKDRKQIKPTEMVLTAVPGLGLKGAASGDESAAAAPSASAAAGGGEEKSGACGCRTGVGASAPTSAWWLSALLVGGWFLRRSVYSGGRPRPPRRGE